MLCNNNHWQKSVNLVDLQTSPNWLFNKEKLLYIFSQFFSYDIYVDSYKFLTINLLLSPLFQKAPSLIHPSFKVLGPICKPSSHLPSILFTSKTITCQFTQLSVREIIPIH